MEKIGEVMSPTNVLLLCGGGGKEHDVSLVSANYLKTELSKIQSISVVFVEIDKNGCWIDSHGQLCHLHLDRTLTIGNEKLVIDYAIPCIHGFPGETGDIQSLFELAQLPYMGCSPAANMICFNKITSKLWFDALDIPNTPYIFLTQYNHLEIKKAQDALMLWGNVFVKAACQGSSVGCYKVSSQNELKEAIEKAFSFSDQVLIEQAICPRELEIAAYHYDNSIIITNPGEVYCPEDSFYSYEEKYSAQSHSQTSVEPSDLTAEQIRLMKEYALKVFVQLKLKDLSRIDFFLTAEGNILLNEINTFPGMTPISMFPQLLKHNGHNFARYLELCIKQGISKN